MKENSRNSIKEHRTLIWVTTVYSVHIREFNNRLRVQLRVRLYMCIDVYVHWDIGILYSTKLNNEEKKRAREEKKYELLYIGNCINRER